MYCFFFWGMNRNLTSLLVRANMALEGIVTGKNPNRNGYRPRRLDILRAAITFDTEEWLVELENR